MTITAPDKHSVVNRKAAGRKPSAHRRLFLVDAALFVAFVLVINVPLTGLAIHEWLGVFLGVATVVHLVQHGNWVDSIRKRFRTSTSLMNRLNFIMLGLLFLAFGTIVISGLIVSESALPFLGVTPAGGEFWLWLHVSSVVATVWLTALHIAFNWTWTHNAITRYVAAPLQAMAGRSGK